MVGKHWLTSSMVVVGIKAAKAICICPSKICEVIMFLCLTLNQRLMEHDPQLWDPYFRQKEENHKDFSATHAQQQK